jgi:hypothetical protein
MAFTTFSYRNHGVRSHEQGPKNQRPEGADGLQNLQVGWIRWQFLPGR